MASITSMMNGSYNTSSIYGTRNVLSGLASGMDTESMIENAVSGIKKKIQSLYQKRTKVEWQQEAYRSIIDKAVNLSNKYTSYSSKTNLLSSSFFTNAVLTTAKGTCSNKVTATGKSSSDIKINAVKQLATAASYTVSGGNGVFGGDVSTVAGSKDVDLFAGMDVSRISGGLSLQYGGSNGTVFDLSFDELDTYYTANDLAGAIREKLDEQTWSYTKNGVQETVKGSDVIDVQVDFDGNIKFTDKTGDGNSVYISYASGDLKSTLDVRTGSGQDTLTVSGRNLSKTVSTREYLSDKELNVSLNGVSKTIKMSDVLGGDENNTDFVNALQKELDKAFGANKVTVSRDEESGEMSFKALEEGSTLTLSGGAVKALGFENGDSNYINTSKKISDLLDSKILESNRLKGTFDTDDGMPTEKTTSSGVKYYVDDAGNRVDEDGYRITDTGELIYRFEINDNQIDVTGDTTLESLMTSINSNVNAGVKVSYSQLTNAFKFTASETGSNSKIEFSGLAQAMFGPTGSSSDNFAEKYGIDLGENGSKNISFKTDDGIHSFDVTSDMTMEDIIAELNKSPFSALGYEASYDERSDQIVMRDEDGNTLDLQVGIMNSESKEITEKYKSQSKFNYTAGQDAVMDVEINGKRFENLTRSGNNFDIDGLNITIKGTFDGKNVEDGKDYEPVTFETVTDSDKIIDAIRSFVNDYNELVTELKSTYSTQPQTDSKNNRYEPLTAEEEADYSESELAAYNEKAKQGILFGDTTLSSMYGKLLNAVAPGGADGQALREIGIGTSYENGLTTLSLNEDKLRAALDSNPDKVKDVFAKTIDGGSSSNGLMQTMQNTLNTYVKTAGEPKGVLITRAGSVKAPTSLNNNSLNTQINNIDKEITRWQDKMASQIDRFTTQFSRLEQLVAAMNSQASALANLMGGYEGY